MRMRLLLTLVRGLFVTVALTCMTASTALAGGFEYNENGAKILGRAGAWGAKADDPMAIHYNPGGLNNWKGHKILINVGLTYLDASLTMLGMEDVTGPGKLFETDRVTNLSPPFVAPALAWAYNDGDWAVGAAIYGPNAYGTRDWGKDGPQQFMLGHADMLLAYLSGSFSYKIIPELSVGVTLQYVFMPYARFGLTIDGGAFPSEQNYGACPDDGDPCEVDVFHTEAELDVADYTAFAAIVGLHIRPFKFLEFGISSRVTPIFIDGVGPAEINFKSDENPLFTRDPGETFATADFVDKACFGGPDGTAFDGGLPGCKPNTNVSLALVLPPWLRLAARYKHLDSKDNVIFDIERDVVVEFWSVLQQYDIAFEGDLKLFSSRLELKELSLPKKYNDTIAVRLGSDVNIIPDLFTLHLGVHFETAASPLAYSNIDFLAFMRMGAAIGFSIKPIRELEISLAYQLIRQPGRVVTPELSKVPMQRPITDPAAPDDWDEETQGKYPGIPANAAIYNASTFHSGSISFTIHFGFDDDEPAVKPAPVPAKTAPTTDG